MVVVSASNSATVKPLTYFVDARVALYTIGLLHFPSNGQVLGSLQLHSLSAA